MSVAGLLRDPVATLEGGPPTGALSQMGLMIWAGAAAILGVAIWLNRRLDWAESGAWWAALLLAVWLLVDDAYLLREDVLSGWGLPDGTALLVIALLSLNVVRTHVLGGLRGRPVSMLLASWVALASSLFADIVELPVAGDVIIEDALKIIGAGLWLGYLATWLVMRLPEAPGGEGLVRPSG